MSQNLFGSLASLGAALSWALAVIAFKKSDAHFGPAGLNTFKNAFALLLLGATLGLLRPSLGAAEDGDVAAMLLSGAAGMGLGDVLFFAALRRLGATRTAIVDTLYTPFAMLSAALLLGDAASSTDLVGAALVVGAVVLATALPAGDTLTPRALWIGAACGASAMLTQAVSVVAIKPMIERTDVLWSTTLRIAGGLLWLLASALFHAPTRREVGAALRPGSSWRAATLGAFFGTYVSPLCWLAGFKYVAHANTAVILNQTSTIFIVLLAAIFLREALSGRRALAVGMAFAGSALVILG